jgi:hypothetical protein
LPVNLGSFKDIKLYELMAFPFKTYTEELELHWM